MNGLSAANLGIRPRSPFDDEGLLVVDFAEPSAPFNAAFGHKARGSCVEVVGQYAVVGDWWMGFTVFDLSYEVFDPQTGAPLEGVFVAGWSREASSGLVGIARKDGQNGANAASQYLATRPPHPDLPGVLDALEQRLSQLPHPIVDKDGIARLDLAEQAEAARRGLETFKFGSNAEMLAAIEGRA